MESINERLLSLSINSKHNETLRDVKVFELANSFQGFCTTDTFPVGIALRKVMKLLDISKNQSDIHMYITISRIVLGNIGQNMLHGIYNQNQRTSRNKETYMSKRICENLLLEGAKVDISRGPLNLALFYYDMNMFNRVIQICNKVLADITPHKVYIQKSKDSYSLQKYKENICGRGLGIDEKMKKAVVLDVIIDPSLRMIYSKEFQYDINAQQSIPKYCPPVPLAIFLKFLCFHELGDINSSLAELHDLKTMTRDNEQGSSKYPAVLNLLAICLDKVGDTTGAVQLCLRSQQLQPGVQWS